MFEKKNITRTDGLIDGLTYVFNENGSINWRKMVDNKYLVPNKQKTEEKDVSKLDDKDLLILLAGIKELADLRGYTEVSYNVVAASPSYFAASCRIKWLPNYETENKERVFEAIADAHPDNTSGFGQFYLAAMAENRAFARCVRNSLKIHVVSQDEIGAKISPQEESVSSSDPASLLKKAMEDKKVPFAAITAALVKDGLPEAKEFASIDQIPKAKIFELIERINCYKPTTKDPVPDTKSAPPTG